MAKQTLSKAERLQEFVRRLTALPPASDFETAWEQLASTLNQVEDELTSIPYNPSLWRTDGRMYPPQLDSETPFPANPRVRRFRNLKENTFIGRNGSIEIRRAVASNPLEGTLVLSKPGTDGRRVMEQ